MTQAETRLSLDRSFALVDANGKAVTGADFPGRWLLIYFGYTHCADQCPTALSTMVEAMDQIGPAAQYIQPLFITVDPKRDRGPMLAAFVALLRRLPRRPLLIASRLPRRGVGLASNTQRPPAVTITHGSQHVITPRSRRDLVRRGELCFSRTFYLGRCQTIIRIERAVATGLIASTPASLPPIFDGARPRCER